MVVTTIDQYFHLALQKDDQHCSTIFNALLRLSCSYSICGSSRIEGLLKKMNSMRCQSEKGQASFGNHPPWRAKDSKTLQHNNLHRHHDQYSINYLGGALPPTSLLPCKATAPGHSKPCTNLEASCLCTQVRWEARPIRIMNRVSGNLDPNSSRRAPAKHQSPLNRGLPLTRT